MEAMPVKRLLVLDGVRGISILLVLSAHLLPLYFFGTKLNESCGLLGMSLFFALSGFLIANQISDGMPLRDFIIKRLSRIVPAAWLCLLVTFLFIKAPSDYMVKNLLFVANLPLPVPALVRPLEHYWSLDVEMQFYVLSGLLMLINRRSVVVVAPALLISVIGARILEGVAAGSNTVFRADDLLAGSCAAILLRNESLKKWAVSIGMGERWSSVLFFILLAGSSFLLTGSEVNPLSYFRSLFVIGLMVSLVLGSAINPIGILSVKPLLYIASISYAMYLWHMPLGSTWLGTGSLEEKYIKRPLLFVCLLLVSHISTFYIEKFFNCTGIKLSSRLGQPYKELK